MTTTLTRESDTQSLGEIVAGWRETCRADRERTGEALSSILLHCQGQTPRTATLQAVVSEQPTTLHEAACTCDERSTGPGRNILTLHDWTPSSVPLQRGRCVTTPTWNDAQTIAEGWNALRGGAYSAVEIILGREHLDEHAQALLAEWARAQPLQARIAPLHEALWPWVQTAAELLTTEITPQAETGELTDEHWENTTEEHGTILTWVESGSYYHTRTGGYARALLEGRVYYHNQGWAAWTASPDELRAHRRWHANDTFAGGNHWETTRPGHIPVGTLELAVTLGRLEDHRSAMDTHLADAIHALHNG